MTGWGGKKRKEVGRAQQDETLRDADKEGRGAGPLRALFYQATLAIKAQGGSGGKKKRDGESEPR